MSAVASKKGMTERDRRRMKANQMSKALTSQKNEKTVTNNTYKKIREQKRQILESTKKSQRSPEKTIEKLASDSVTKSTKIELSGDE